MSRAERGFRLEFGPDGPITATLSPEDLSISYDAARREVRTHPAGELIGDDVFAVLDDLLDGDPDTVWVGYFGYACRPDLPARPAVGVPDAVWMRCRRPARPAPDRTQVWVPGPPLPPTTAPSWYAEGFAEVQRQLRAGNSYEVNLTYRLESMADPDPAGLYLRLLARNPAPYAGRLHHHGTHLLSASPECFARIDRRDERSRIVQTRPIKGTTARGSTTHDDARLRDQLATDPKFRAENLIVTDLLRNDLSMVCLPGSVEVPELMVVESYASVHQLVTTVQGRLRDEVSTVAALHAMFPAGSMTGAPKLRTMQVIDAVEGSPRGVYAGAFGWITGDGRADLGVVIRSLVRAPDGVWRIGTGGGITVGSDLAEEWAESRWKVTRLLDTLVE